MAKCYTVNFRRAEYLSVVCYIVINSFINTSFIWKTILNNHKMSVNRILSGLKYIQLWTSSLSAGRHGVQSSIPGRGE